MRDVYVYSQDIYFTASNPDIGQAITILANVNYSGSQPATGIPVTINDIFPVSGSLATLQVGSTLVDFSNGNTDSPVGVTVPWSSTAAGAHVIQAVAAPPFSQNTGNDKATRLIFVGPPPAVTIDKSVALLVDADSSGNISPGDTLRYTITYTNTGASAVTGAQVLDDYDETFLEPPSNISSGGAASSGAITWSVGTVAAGASGSVSYDVYIRPASVFPAGTSTIVNYAFLDTDQTPAVGDSVEIQVTKEAGQGGPPVVGGVVGLLDAPSDEASQRVGGSDETATLLFGFGAALAAIAAAWYIRRRWLA